MLSKAASTLLFSIALILSGCRSNETQQTTMKSQSEQKPIVALVPVIDNTKNTAWDWNLSDEFTASIYSCLEQGPLYMESMPRVIEILKGSKELKNPFGMDIAWIKDTYEKEQFVIFLELVEHQEILKQDALTVSDPKTTAADLKLCMRVRVFDLRGEQPQVILQELIQDSHYVPRQFTQANFCQVSWGDENFIFSPLGIAHWEFAQEVALRIEDYIQIAQLKKN
jgi:hypothetical protein